MGSNAFQNCASLAALAFGTGLGAVSDYAFCECTSLGSITWGGITSIGDGAFWNCTGLTSVTFPSGMTAIGEDAFGYTGLTTLEVNVPAIGSWAFGGCASLGSLTIGPAVESIGGYAFASCTSLASVMVLRSESVPESGYGLFNNTSNSLIIYVPGVLLSAYKSAWSDYSNQIQGWIHKDIAAYGTGNDKWAFISSPFTDDTDPEDVGNLVGTLNSETGLYDFDLYRLNNTVWENYNNPDHHDDFVLENGKGYLYASQNGTTLVFIGEMNTGTTKAVSLSRGYNLVGNPFPVDAYINKPYYKLDENGSRILPTQVTTDTPIASCTGVIVEAVGGNGTVTFSTTAPETNGEPNRGNLQIAVANANMRGASTGSATIDKAIVSFNEGDQLGKFYFGEQNANIYIPQGAEEYAIATSNGQGEMPLNFKAKEDGQYTISVNPENVEMNYLHLIDNITGTDVDLLALRHPSTGSGAEAQGPAEYTFTAKTTDYASRFRLVFICGDADGDNENFAFISNGNLIINGEGAAQMVDMMGRVVVSVDGRSRCVPTTGMVPGVYVLRLIDGNDVKTQKIVID